MNRIWPGNFVLINSQAVFAIRECPALEQWACILKEPATAKEKYDSVWQQQAAEARAKLLSDDVTNATFGVPLSRWGDDQAAAIPESVY